MTKLNLNNREYILYLEPYVYINKDERSAILYNTLSGTKLFVNDCEVLKLIRKLQLSSNIYVVKIRGDKIRKNKEILNFIEEIRTTFMGNLIIKKEKGKKPIQLMPILNNYKDIKKIKKESVSSVGEKVLEYLNEISIYVNNECSKNCDICKYAYKQIKFCTKSKKKDEINFDLLKSALSDISKSNLSIINILGGNIFSYGKLIELSNILREIKAVKNIYIHYLNLFDDIEKIKILDDMNIKILISSDIDKYRISEINNYMVKIKVNKEYIFAVTDEEDFNTAQKLIAELHIDVYSFNPVYNETNIDFFNENIFIDSNDLENVKLSMKNIFAKNSMNTNNFGKLIIKENGKIYSNLNGKNLGELEKDTIKDIIYQDLKAKNSYWLKSRVNVKPCKNCLNNFLCPPLSNYEYAMKKNNLCKIVN